MAAIEIDPTPNPNSLKFTLQNQVFIAEGLESFNSPGEAARHPLGKALFDITGVSGILLVPQFLTITKEPDADWDEIIPAVREVIDQFYAT